MRSHTITIGMTVILSASALRAQEGPHGLKGDIGRGDVHSPGWSKIEELKGEPLGPRFPAWARTSSAWCTTTAWWSTCARTRGCRWCAPT
ncbi:MAG: hypothetical protein U1E76_19345 [Planctomycetota bacterium]